MYHDTDIVIWSSRMASNKKKLNYGTIKANPRDINFYTMPCYEI